MVQFRPQGREVIAKVVYYGPPLGGKTTNLRSLYNGYPDDTRGELVVVPAGGDRTIFFDFLSLEAGNLRGMKLRVQLYTVPGQVHYNATRQVVLRGVDAVVFVADSQREMVRSNRESWENLKDNLLLQGLSLQDMPHVLQYNKRDLPDVLSIDDVDALLNQYNAPFYEAVASTGIGVEETLQGVVKLLVRSLRDRFKLGAEHSHDEAVHPPAAAQHVAAQHVAAPVVEKPQDLSGGARIFSFGPAVTPAPPGVVEPIPVLDDQSGRPRPAPEEGEEPDVTRKVRVPPFGEEAEIPPEIEDPFACEMPREAEAGDDVFGAVLPEATEASTVEMPPAEAEAAGMAAGLNAEGESPEAFGLDALAPVLEVPTPLVGDELYEVAVGSGGGVSQGDGAGAQFDSIAASAAAEEPGFEPPGMIDRLRTPVEPAWIEEVEDRVGESAGLDADTPRAEFDSKATENAAAGSEEPAAEAAVPDEEEPFGEADEVGTATTAQRLFMGAGFVDAVSSGAVFVEDDGSSSTAEFEAEVVPAGSAAAVLSDREDDAVEVHAEAGAEGDAESADATQTWTEPAAEDEGAPAGQGWVGPGGEDRVSAEPAVGHENSLPTQGLDESEGGAEAGEIGEGGEEPPAVVAIPSSAIRRVVPRALAQIGEVRELEIEVPVPSPWTGGKRMTLQLRLTLVPQEEEHGE